MSENTPLRALVPDALKHELSRRGFLGGALSATALLALAGCAPQSGSSSASGMGDSLNIYTWGDYDDPTVLKEFTAEFGPAITIDSYGSNPEMIAKLSAGRGTTGYDLCVPSHLFIPQMVAASLLEPLDHSLLPNMSHLDPAFMDTSWDPGNRHTIPKAWGSTGYAYDTQRVSRPMTSWADFWEVAQNEASGRLSLLQDQIAISNAYFFANGIDPQRATAADIEAYRKFILTDIAPHVQVFQSTTADSIAQSNQILLQAWNGDVRTGKLLNSDPERYQFVWPSEGSNRWMDNWAIVAGSPNAAAAHAFINHVLDPEISLRELQHFGYGTGVLGVEEQAAAAGVEMRDLIFIDDAIVSKLIFDEANETNETIIKIYDELSAKAGS